MVTESSRFLRLVVSPRASSHVGRSMGSLRVTGRAPARGRPGLGPRRGAGARGGGDADGAGGGSRHRVGWAHRRPPQVGALRSGVGVLRAWCCIPARPVAVTKLVPLLPVGPGGAGAPAPGMWGPHLGPGGRSKGGVVGGARGRGRSWGRARPPSRRARPRENAVPTGEWRPHGVWPPCRSTARPAAAGAAYQGGRPGSHGARLWSINECLELGRAGPGGSRVERQGARRPAPLTTPGRPRR
jgi:hypothetical protein